MLSKKDNDKQCIFGVATAVSPDLQLSIEKAKMMAKSELADIIKGEMNKESKQFIKELGKTETKTVVTEVETAIVNVISDTPVRGYEIFAQDVTLTKNGYYRTWIGMRLPLGEYNKMFNYTIEQAVDAYNLNSESKKAWENLKNKSTIKNKKIILVDDSLVRGTTSHKIVKMLYDFGAKEVHVRIASPEIRFPDFYGVDTPTKKELLAANKTNEEICKYIDAKSLKFLSVDGLYRAMGYEKRNSTYPQLTDHYFTGDYPVKLIDDLGDNKVTQLSLLSTKSNN